MQSSDRIFVAGHGGLVGAAIVRALRSQGYESILTATRQQLDLNDQGAVFGYFEREQPQALVNAAAVVGGIVANRDYPGDFIGSNLMIQTNLLEAARRSGTALTLFISSGCIYPREAPIPTTENDLLTGPLEPTNQWYAVAKIAGVKMGEAYAKQFGMRISSVMPCNIYGEHDNFDLETAHVVPALVRKLHEAKLRGDAEAAVWGTGKALREFIHVDDLASACVHILEHGCPQPLINVGSGKETSIAELAALIAEAYGFGGKLVFDTSRPDGTPRKMLDSSRMQSLGWSPQIALPDGIARLCRWYESNAEAKRETDPAAWRRAA